MHVLWYCDLIFGSDVTRHLRRKYELIILRFYKRTLAEIYFLSLEVLVLVLVKYFFILIPSKFEIIIFGLREMSKFWF